MMKGPGSRVRGAAFDRGNGAYFDNKAITDNPNESGSVNWQAWRNGWLAGRGGKNVKASDDKIDRRKDKLCESCVFWVGEAGFEVRDCHGGPPSVIVNGGGQETVWPKTKAYDFCGTHKNPVGKPFKGGG